MTPTDAGVRLWTNETDTVVAASVDDAWAVWSAHTGEMVDDYHGEMEWTQVPGDEPIKVWIDRDGNVSEPGDGATLETKTAAEWVAKLGRGFAWSTEF